MVVSSILTSAAALRSKYLTATAYNNSLTTKRTAVVVGATSGIGRAISHRLAEQGYTVIAVGRSRPGRDEAIVKTLEDKSAQSASNLSLPKETPLPRHEFRPCDAFCLSEVDACAKSILQDHPVLDALILTQGMATIQGFTATVPEGNDEKITLHYWSRIAMTNALLPSLRKSQMKKGAVVLTVLSGGVHSPFLAYEKDPELKTQYSIQNAANMAGFYNDLAFDHMARQPANEGINFVHAAPGFVNTNWGTEMPWYIRSVVRAIQPLGRSASDCAEYMTCPTVLASDAGDPLPSIGKGNNEKGIIVMGPNGEPAKLTSMHTTEANNFVWNVTSDVLDRAGIQLIN
mmetsp:Transcript_27588/g.39484  ORF Transcript_27588/g.39484 Transcript_27588/m.39484 type:complete len:345 (-) Transcript_27588:152-1186(-)